MGEVAVTPARPRRRLALVAFGAFVALALFALAEAALRLLDVGARRELLSIEIDGRRHLTREPAFAQLAADPSLSLDRIAVAVEKPPQVLRVVVAGESTAAGFPFYPQLSFGRLLEASLRELLPDLAVEVVNLGRAADPSDAVARAAIESLQAQPDVLVVLSGHNEYQASYVEDLRDGAWPRVRSWLRRLRVVAALAGRSLAHDSPVPEIAAGQRVGDAAWLSASELARGAARFRGNLDRIAAAARDAGADLILVTPPSNLSGFGPCYSHHSRALTTGERREYERLLGELEAALDATLVPESMPGLIERLGRLDPAVARLQFLMGRAHERAGATAAAAICFAQALEFDGYPNRARGALVREVHAAAFAHDARLVDAIAAFSAASDGGAPGDAHFLDYCHPTIEGMCLLADAVRPALVQTLMLRGALIPPGYRDQAMLEIAPLATWLERLGLSAPALAGGLVRAGQGSLLIHLRLPSERESLRLAKHAFEQALRVAPGLEDALAGGVVVALLEGRSADARSLGEELERVAPDALERVVSKAAGFETFAAALDRCELRLDQGRLRPR